MGEEVLVLFTHFAAFVNAIVFLLLLLSINNFFPAENLLF